VAESIVTVEHFIAEQQRRHPDATGAFTDVLLQISLAAKIISRSVNKAGLVDIIGATENHNVHGEQVQKLDEYAHDVFVQILGKGGRVCGIVSEESDHAIRIPEGYDVGPYVVAIDPLDGSSNIDVNVSVGTIFSVHRKRSLGRDAQPSDALQPGAEQCAAGYVHYGASTMLVFTTGAGTHGFTLDPSIGEFLLSHRDMKMPSPGKKVYSVNEGYTTQWSEGQRSLMRYLRGEEGAAGGFSARYVGSMVADVHRTMLRGGLFMYPGTVTKPEGKLRLLYEVAPMAFVCEQAGGLASDGRRRILEIQPTELHQRVPAFIGSPELVERAEDFLVEDQ